MLSGFRRTRKNNGAAADKAAGIATAGAGWLEVSGGHFNKVIGHLQAPKGTD
jgi:hypothetical protein